MFTLKLLPQSLQTRLVAGLALTAASLVIAGTAQAKDAATPRVTVHYSELNLQNAAGVETLYRRLTAAAKQVCAAQDDRDLRAQMAFRDCVSTSLEHAVRDVRSAAVLALHVGKSKGSHPT